MATITKSTKPVEQLVLWASSRTSGSYGAPTWEIPIPPRPAEDERVVLSLDSWIFPNRLPLITSSNQSVSLIEDPAGAADTFALTITAGDYQSIRTLNTELQTQIDAAATTNTYLVSYNSVTERITLTATAGATAFNLTFPSVAAGSLAHCFGFGSLVNTAAAGALTGSARVDLFSDKVAILSCLGLSGVQTFVSSSGRRSNVLAVIPLTSPAGYLQVFKASQSHYRVEMPVGVPLTELTLSVRSQSDEQLDVDWDHGVTMLVSFERVERKAQ